MVKFAGMTKMATKKKHLENFQKRAKERSSAENV